MISKYRTKPCEIEAVRWDGTNVRKLSNLRDKQFSGAMIALCAMEVRIHTQDICYIFTPLKV